MDGAGGGRGGDCYAGGAAVAGEARGAAGVGGDASTGEGDFGAAVLCVPLG